MTIDCAREQDVLDAVSAGRWPARLDADLRTHLDGCDGCRDAAAVFAALAEDRDEAWDALVVPPSSVVWWRAQIRAREEAVRTAARPIAVAQGVAVALAVAAAILVLPLALPLVRGGAAAAVDGLAWLLPRASAVSAAFSLVTGAAFEGRALPILPFAIASLLLAPALLYYVLSEE